ncbi:hypothetical protein B0H17DRAFT_1131913 [Mycena rosella]|uniref:Uncharacterized protein n=1 Tax=Mycena rosella TaxID=1033263 RepID=A0AAD7GK40_MYCRO|nr:hypothetical protein B0H17DRAFT_1131913 [Mycena rosella]
MEDWTTEIEDNNWLDNDIAQTAKVETSDDPSDAVSIHPFKEGHELYETHYIRCDRRNLEKAVPNFLGGVLTRKDLGDREFYCCTMLTMFKPWRSGKDLKNPIDNWDETFREYIFHLSDHRRHYHGPKRSDVGRTPPFEIFSSEMFELNTAAILFEMCGTVQMSPILTQDFGRGQELSEESLEV